MPRISPYSVQTRENINLSPDCSYEINERKDLTRSHYLKLNLGLYQNMSFNKLDGSILILQNYIYID